MATHSGLIAFSPPDSGILGASLRKLGRGATVATHAPATPVGHSIQTCPLRLLAVRKAYEASNLTPKASAWVMVISPRRQNQLELEVAAPGIAPSQTEATCSQPKSKNLS